MEVNEMKSEENVLNIMRDFVEIINSSITFNQGVAVSKNKNQKEELGPIQLVKHINTLSSFSNDHFINFKVFEMMHTKSGSAVKINNKLIKKISSLCNSTSNLGLQANGLASVNQMCFYKMLKCEAKLIKFILELNGLVSTDRHNWNMLWTHTQGKNYFYERLTPTQKINHFPLSFEITRKDRLAINIKKMQQKYSRTYFNFIPETYVLPEEFEKFEERFKYYH